MAGGEDGEDQHFFSAGLGFKLHGQHHVGAVRNGIVDGHGKVVILIMVINGGDFVGEFGRHKGLHAVAKGQGQGRGNAHQQHGSRQNNR